MAAPTTDIFGRLPLSYGGSFSADAAVVVFGGLTNGQVDPSVSLSGGSGTALSGGVGLLTQSIQFQYQQQVTRLYEIGTRNVFYVAGRSMGNAGVSRILGPRAVTAAFYVTYGNVCNAGNNTLIFAVGTGCNVPGDLAAGLTLAMIGVVLVGLSESIGSPEMMIIAEQLQLMFIALLV